MSSLCEILAAHGSLLVLDGSGAAQAAWFAGAQAPVRAGAAEGEAGVGIFRAVSTVCPRPNEAGAFAFCAAPGSVLGIRTTAAAIRSWTALRSRPVYSYHALQLAATAGVPANAYIADARRGHWHYYRAGQPLGRLATAELAAARGDSPLVTLQGYRHWEPLPPGTLVQPYEIGALFSAAATQDLFQWSDSPDAALIAPPSYVQWTPRIHQTP